RAGGGPMTCLAPAGEGFFYEPCLLIMLGENFRLAVHQLRGMGFERLGDPCMQLLPSIAQQAAMRRVLYQRMLEAVDRFRRRPALEHQLGSGKPGEGSLQL